MTKIYLKIVLMFALAVFVYALIMLLGSCNLLVLMCMVILPIALFVWACRSGRMDDVLAWFEEIEGKMKTY